MQSLCFSEEEMAIRKEDWPAINRAIDAAVAEAIKPLTPRGWRKALHALREIAPLGGIFTLVVALAAIVATLGVALVNRSGVEATFRGKTEEKLSNIDRDLIGLRALVASSQPNKTQNQDAAKALLAEARENVIPPIPTPVIEAAGNSFIDASENNTGAWIVALDFVEYASSLNLKTGPPLLQQRKDSATLGLGSWPMPVLDVILKSGYSARQI